MSKALETRCNLLINKANKPRQKVTLTFSKQASGFCL